MLCCLFLCGYGLYESCFKDGGDFVAGATVMCIGGLSFLIVSKDYKHEY
jgi:hypothetical protein